MKIFNIRCRFANNSSSSHYIIFHPNITKIRQKLGYEGNWYGWGNFILSDRKEIDRYVRAQAYSALINDSVNLTSFFDEPALPPDQILAWLRAIWPDTTEKDLDHCGVDHQSRMVMPVPFAYKTPFPDIAFVKALRNYLLIRPTVVIACDEEEKGPFVEESAAIVKQGRKSNIEEIPRGESYDRGKWTVLEDNGVWKLFNLENGTKVRLSFDDNAKYEKSSSPELVDLIISDACSKNCNFCYRGCTSNGKFADFACVRLYITELMNLNVFEIVVGGGDILNYPYLDELCAYIKECRKIKNTAFNTTIRVDANALVWAVAIRRLYLILETFDSVAFSDPDTNVLNFIKALGADHLSIQIIPEIMDDYELDDFISACKDEDLSVTLLGFKIAGRACDRIDQFDKQVRERHDNVEWFHKLEKALENGSLGVDTQFLINFPELAATFDPVLYTTKEGAFSCCIDAVDNTIAKSSYASETYPVKADKEIIKKIFGTF